MKPSERSLTSYFSEQIVYQLREKKNLREADRAYKQFAALKTDSLAAYDLLATRSMRLAATAAIARCRSGQRLDAVGARAL